MGRRAAVASWFTTRAPTVCVDGGGVAPTEIRSRGFAKRIGGACWDFADAAAAVVSSRDPAKSKIATGTCSTLRLGSWYQLVLPNSAYVALCKFEKEKAYRDRINETVNLRPLNEVQA
jgi:hypothetical protein